VKSFKSMCDNEAVVKACKRKRTQGLFHRTEGDHDLISTIHHLQESWCQDMDVQYEWVKEHTYDLNRNQKKLECLNIVSDQLCVVVRETARGPYGARPNCGLWSSERCTLFKRGVKVTINWKERLTQQILDGDIQVYLMDKEQWTLHALNNICWKREKTALTRVS
jgi:hypothetical protein